MSTSNTKDHTHLVFNWFEACEKANILLSFKGDFNEDLVSAILLLAEREPDMQSGTTLVKSRIFSIMVECMQNIRKYGAMNDKTNEFKPGIVLVCKDNKSYSLKIGNLVKNEQVEPLTSYLEKIRVLNKEELKTLHKKVLSEGQLSAVSGAGLGFISILRKCDKFVFDFKKLSDQITFFSLDIYIFI